MQISIPLELEKEIEVKVAAGQYGSAEDVVLAGVELLLERDRLFHEHRKDWESMIEEGIRQADAGEVIDGEDFLKSLQ